MDNVQLSFFYNYKAIVASSDFYRKYDAIFSALDLSSFPGTNEGPGCTGYSRRAILRAFIVKHLEEIKSVRRLIEFLDAHPMLTEMCGFKPGGIPEESSGDAIHKPSSASPPGVSDSAGHTASVTEKEPADKVMSGCRYS